MSSPPDPKRARTGSRDPSAFSASPQFALPAIPVPGPTDPRPAASSTSSRRQPASAVARDLNAFEEAMTANNFIYRKEAFEDVNLTRIYDNVKLPTTVNDPEFIQLSSRFSGHLIAFDDDSLSPDDPHDLAQLKQHFLYLWRDFTFASGSGSVFGNGSEMDLRTAMDALIRQAFDSRCRKYDEISEPASVFYRTEQEICLPAERPGIARANAVVWSEIPPGFQYLFQGLSNAHVFSAESRRRHDLLATFVFEAKLWDENAAIRQICFDLCSAQHQRRALGFENHQIYGALLVGSFLTLYASKWIDNRVSIQPTTTVFDLRGFPIFLELFVFLRQLANYIHKQTEEMGGELEKDEAGFKERIIDAVWEPWRPLKHASGPRSGTKSPQGDSAVAGEGMSEEW